MSKSLHFVAVVNLSLLSSFKPTTPPHKMFWHKYGIFPSCALEVARNWTKFLCVERTMPFSKVTAILQKLKLFYFVLIMFLMLNTPSVSQVFFSFYKRLYYYKVRMNLKEH